MFNQCFLVKQWCLLFQRTFSALTFSVLLASKTSVTLIHPIFSFFLFCFFLVCVCVYVWSDQALFLSCASQDAANEKGKKTFSTVDIECVRRCKREHRNQVMLSRSQLFTRWIAEFTDAFVDAFHQNSHHVHGVHSFRQWICDLQFRIYPCYFQSELLDVFFDAQQV